MHTNKLIRATIVHACKLHARTNTKITQKVQTTANKQAQCWTKLVTTCTGRFHQFYLFQCPLLHQTVSHLKGEREMQIDSILCKCGGYERALNHFMSNWRSNILSDVPTWGVEHTYSTNEASILKWSANTQCTAHDSCEQGPYQPLHRVVHVVASTDEVCEALALIQTDVLRCISLSGLLGWSHWVVLLVVSQGRSGVSVWSTQSLSRIYGSTVKQTDKHTYGNM